MNKTNEVYDMMQILASCIDDAINPPGESKLVFTLLIFNEEDGDTMVNYVSNGHRDEIVNAMRECADRIERKQIERSNEH